MAADYAGLALAIPKVISSLAEVISDTKDAPKDIQDLRRELLAGLYTIKGSLSSLDDLPDQSRHKLDAEGWMQRADAEIMSMMEKDVRTHSSVLGRTKQYATWHWDKKKVKDHLEKVESIKSWFVMAITTGVASSVDQLSRNVRLLEISIGEDRDEKLKQGKQSFRRRLLRYLAPLSPEAMHRKSLSSHKPGTSTWFIGGPLQKFLGTSRGDLSVLWLQGKSGSGKTTLLAKSIDHLRSNGKSLEVLYWYCAFDDRESQKSENFLGWIIASLAHRVPDLLDPLMKQMEDAEKKGAKPVFLVSELKETLLEHSTGVPPVIIFIDAINESAENEGLELLVTRLATEIPSIRVIVSSTNNMVNQNAGAMISEMSGNALHRDIDLVITNILETDGAFSSLSADIRKKIHDTVLSRSDGMFRYAHCVMGQLTKKGNGRRMVRALEDLPSDLNVIYARILSDLQWDPDIFKEALRWLCFSQKPLELKELAELVVIENDDIDITEDMRLPDPIRVLVEQSNGLVVYDAETSIVSLGHSSVKAFLTTHLPFEMHKVSYFAIGTESDSYHHMLKAFLKYLSFSEFKNGYGSIDKTTFGRYHALKYVSSCWPDYVQATSLDDWELVSNFFKTRVDEHAGSYGAWINMLAANLPLRVVQRTQPIYYAAAFDYASLVEAILRHENNLNLEAPGGRHGSTVLQMACFRLRKKIALLLVEAGADPVSQDGSFPSQNSIWWAQQNGWYDLARRMKIQAGQPCDDEERIDADLISHQPSSDKTLRTDYRKGLTYISSHQLTLKDVEEYMGHRFKPDEFKITTIEDGAEYRIRTYVSTFASIERDLNYIRGRDFQRPVDDYFP